MRSQAKWIDWNHGIRVNRNLGSLPGTRMATIRERTVRPVSSVGTHWCGFASATAQEVRRITSVVVGVLMKEGMETDGLCGCAGRLELTTSAFALGAILAHAVPAMPYRSVLATVGSGTGWGGGDARKLHASTDMTQQNSQCSLPCWVHRRDPRGCRSIRHLIPPVLSSTSNLWVET